MSVDIVTTETPAECPRELIETRLAHAQAVANGLIRADPSGDWCGVWEYFENTLGEALAYIEKGCPKAEQEGEQP